jgi:hypothetical protein
MKLFELHTAGLGVFYVVDEDPTTAETRLNELLERATYGFSDDRRIVSIRILTSEITPFPGDKPNFSAQTNRLILPTSCPVESLTPNP